MNNNQMQIQEILQQFQTTADCLAEGLQKKIENLQAEKIPSDSVSQLKKQSLSTANEILTAYQEFQHRLQSLTQETIQKISDLQRDTYPSIDSPRSQRQTGLNSTSPFSPR